MTREMAWRLQELISMGTYMSEGKYYAVTKCLLNLSEGVDRQLWEKGYFKCAGNPKDGYSLIIPA